MTLTARETFPFFPGDLLLGEGGDIGLCTLWTPRDRYAGQLGGVRAIGNLYSHFGIGILIRNVLATPSVRQIVVTGVDCPEKTRRQADMLLGGGFDPAVMYLTAEDVALFYKRVLLHDARHIGVREQGKLASLIEDLPAAPPLEAAPLYLPLPEVSSTIYPAPRGVATIQARTIREAHYRLLQEIRAFGQYTQPDSEGHLRQELWQLTVAYEPDGDRYLEPVPLYERAELEAYGDDLWDGTEPEDVTYRYGHTMRARYGDQVAAAIEAFRKKPETFRTVISLWEPLQSMLRDDEPCLVLVHPRIRGGRLDLWAYIRTNEMYRAYPKNAAGLRRFQLRLAEAVGVEAGALTTTSGSAHIYDYDWPVIDTYLKESRAPSFLFDQKGDWNFRVEQGQYVGEHYKDGQLLQIVHEPTIDRLEQRVLPFISDISHGVYIGRMLERLKQRN